MDAIRKSFLEQAKEALKARKDIRGLWFVFVFKCFLILVYNQGCQPTQVSTATDEPPALQAKRGMVLGISVFVVETQRLEGFNPHGVWLHVAQNCKITRVLRDKSLTFAFSKVCHVAALCHRRVGCLQSSRMRQWGQVQGGV